MSFGVFKSTKTKDIFERISAWASEKRSNQKSSVRESKPNPPISGIKCHLKTPKGHFKINWPLELFVDCTAIWVQTGSTQALDLQ